MDIECCTKNVALKTENKTQNREQWRHVFSDNLKSNITEASSGCNTYLSLYFILPLLLFARHQTVNPGLRNDLQHQSAVKLKPVTEQAVADPGFASRRQPEGACVPCAPVGSASACV